MKPNVEKQTVFELLCLSALVALKGHHLKSFIYDVEDYRSL